MSTNSPSVNWENRAAAYAAMQLRDWGHNPDEDSLRRISDLAPQNNQNQTPRKGGTSRYRGVNFHPYSGLWAVRVKANGKTLSGGYFKDEDEAGAAAAQLRAEHMPYAV